MPGLPSTTDLPQPPLRKRQKAPEPECVDGLPGLGLEARQDELNGQFLGSDEAVEARIYAGGVGAQGVAQGWVGSFPFAVRGAVQT